MIHLMIMMMSELRICRLNWKLADFQEQDEPFEGMIISKLENNSKVNMEFSLLINNKFINNQEHKLEKVLAVFWLK